MAATTATTAAAAAAAAAAAGEESLAAEKRDPHVGSYVDYVDYVDYSVVAAGEALYDSVCEGVTTRLGFMASHAGRKNLREEEQLDSSFHFGEALFRPVACALEKVKRKYGGLPAEGGGVFYDLGAGTGKMCVAAAVTHRFDLAVGIEILPELHAWGQKVARRFAASSHPLTQETEIKMVLGDIREYPWWDDANLIFCNTLAFSEALLDVFAERLSRLRPGVIILHSGRINEKPAFQAHFELLEFGFHRFSWGSSSIWYHRRKSS